MHPEYKILSKNYYPILAALVVRDGYACARCGRTKHLVVDHIVPVKRDGKTELNNLQLLCHGCNGVKGNTIVDYRPDNRGTLGYEPPRYTAHGALIIRIYHWARTDNNETLYDYLDSEVLRFRAKNRVRVLFTDGRVLNADLRNVYPPDLQHLFPIV